MEKALIVLVIMALSVSVGLAQSDNFDDGKQLSWDEYVRPKSPPGNPPTAWADEVADPTRDDIYAVNGEYELPFNPSPMGYRSTPAAISVISESDYTYFDMQTDFRLYDVYLGNWCSMSLVWGFQDYGDGATGGFDDKGNSANMWLGPRGYEIWEFVDGDIIGAAPYDSVSRNGGYLDAIGATDNLNFATWHTIRLRYNEAGYSIWIDDIPALMNLGLNRTVDYTDHVFTGQVGLGANRDLVMFDNFSVVVPPPAIVGDLNSDGFVGGDDLNIILGGWGQDVARGGWGDGDPSGDGFVGGDDLNLVLGNWGAGTPPSLGDVPEPTTMLILSFGAVGAMLRRKR